MKFLPSQLAYLLSHRETRQNLRSLGQYIALLCGIIAAFAVTFHLIMEQVEHQQHSWLTGLYWTLTVMTTLGFGDITFHSDLGRAFSLLVLLTGVIMLLIVLPFMFIRFFYAPWLEAQLRFRAPRRLAEGTKNHVIICRFDDVGQALVRRLVANGIPYVVLEPDPASAASLMSDAITVVAGDTDDVATYDSVAIGAARLVVANASDAANCNITLTVRERTAEVPVVALVEDHDAIDILQLAGASHVMVLKDRLGEQLAARVTSGAVRSHVLGKYGHLAIAEIPAHGTMLAGRPIRETRLRELTGVHIVTYWERGRMLAARPDSVLNDASVAVVVGTMEQIERLDATLGGPAHNDNPVLVVGGGKVGRATLRALRARGIAATVIERDPALEPRLREIADTVIVGDAADRDELGRAGIDHTPSVVLTNNDDAVNIFLALYCRKLNPGARIVSRITHERNLEAIHRAGADFALSYTTIASKYLMSHVLGRDLVILGEGVDVHVVAVPDRLVGRTLAESGIGAETGLTVVGVQTEGKLDTALTAKRRLAADTELVMIGTAEQRTTFQRRYGKSSSA